MNLTSISTKIKRSRPVLFALLAAILFALNAPLSKLLLGSIDPLFLAALLYLGAGAGMLFIGGLRREDKTKSKKGWRRLIARCHPQKCSGYLLSALIV